MMEISFKQTIFSLDSKNKKCNDCGDDEVKFVSVNNGITLCELCAQIHQNFGYHISFIRSIDDEFDDYLMNFFIYGGNKKFRRKLREMGVNLDVKKAKLYRTFGADYYRRNLKAIVKGNSQIDKDFDNANEVMQIESNAFPEFENYIINSYNNNQPNLSILNNLQIDLGTNANFESNIVNNPLENMNNIPIAQENKIESIKNEPDNKQQEQNEQKESANGEENINIKKVMDYSLKGAKRFGSFVKTNGIKGFGLMKKYGGILAQKSKPTIQNATNYVKEHVPYFNKNKNNSSDNTEKEKEDEKNQ